MIRVDVDFAWEEKLQDVLLSIRAEKGKILDFDPIGPGGGNPNLLLGFPSEQEALSFLTTRYPEDALEFHRSRLETV